MERKRMKNGKNKESAPLTMYSGDANIVLKKQYDD